MQLPKLWPRHVRSAIVHTVSMARVAFTVVQSRAEHHWSERIRLRSRVERLESMNRLLAEELRIQDARMAQIEPQRRPHYPPAERLAILELRAAWGWTLEATARRFLITPLTVTHWMQRLDDEGPHALVQVPVPVNRFPNFVEYIVRRLKTLCPRMGTRRIAAVLARASLHLGGTTIRRMLQSPAPRRWQKKRRASKSRVVTAKRPNHLWHVDLTVVPIFGGFWIPWWPLSIPQRWPLKPIWLTAGEPTSSAQEKRHLVGEPG